MIAGIVKCSLIDFPNKVACVIFLSGCNFRCPYCHNKELVINDKKMISLIELEHFLTKRQGLLEGVVISGGEPTLDKNLFILASKIKSFGYKVKLDTNGSNPKVLQKLIKHKLVDYIAMDIKGAPSRYSEIIGKTINMENISQSIKIILASGIENEFRTTLMEEFHDSDDFKEIGKLVEGADNLYLQNYRYTNNQLIDKKYNIISDELMSQIRKTLLNYVKNVTVR